jgi:hypothetical protein
MSKFMQHDHMIIHFIVILCKDTLPMGCNTMCKKYSIWDCVC